MESKDKNIAGLFDFPLSPTPSLKAHHEFTKLIREYLSMFDSSGGVLSVGPIKLGTPARPFINAPIEMDPRKIEDRLRHQLSKFWKGR